MKISLIAAVAENNVIGYKNRLPWRLPADFKHFKEITMGHHLIMGQNTFESIGRPLPGRQTVILSLEKDYKKPGCKTSNSIEEALKIAKDNGEKEVMIVGGSSVYKQFLPISNKIYLTKIHHRFEGDAFFPEIDMNEWKTTSEEKHNTDAKNPYPYDFIVLERRS